MKAPGQSKALIKMTLLNNLTFSKDPPLTHAQGVQHTVSGGKDRAREVNKVHLLGIPGATKVAHKMFELFQPCTGTVKTARQWDTGAGSLKQQ